jgi:hypothetical protein
MIDIELHAFSYGVFNVSGSNQLTSMELHRGINAIYSMLPVTDLRLCEEQAEPLLDTIDELPTKGISLDEYLKCIDNYRRVLLPFFELQAKMRNYIFGERYWLICSPKASAIKRSPDVEIMFSEARAIMYAGFKKKKDADTATQLASAESKYASLSSRR